MATKKVTELTALTNAASGDLLLIVDDPLGSPETKKITVGDLIGNVKIAVTHNANVTLSNTSVLSANSVIIRDTRTPANSTITVAQGTVFYDSATAQNWHAGRSKLGWRYNQKLKENTKQKNRSAIDKMLKQKLSEQLKPTTQKQNLKQNLK